MPMSAFARFLCKGSPAHNPPPATPKVTQTSIDNALAQSKITPEEYACINDPECPCDWTTAAAVAAEEPAPEA